MNDSRTARSVVSILRPSIAALLVISLALLVPVAGMGDSVSVEWWVDDGGSDANPGTEEEPFGTITHAMSVASSGDTIWVEPGTYPQSLVIGHRPGVWMESTGGADVTTIQGSGSNPCVIMTNPLANTALVGFTIKNGSWAFGGGVASHRTPGLGTLTDGWPLIADNIITENVATSHDGGGVHFEAPADSPFAPRVIGNKIRDNDAAAGGGGIYCTANVNPTVKDNRFFFNEADSGGAFMAVNGSTPVIQDNTMVANKALAGNGGAIHLSLDGTADPVVAGNSIIGNQAAKNGGAAYFSSCEPVVDGNEIAGNSATAGHGGAVYLIYGIADLSNNLIYNNNASAGDGGAAYSYQSLIKLNGDTVYGNTAASGFAGVYANTAQSGSLQVRNSILWDHGMEDVSGASIIAYSDTQDTTLAADNNTVGDGVIHSDPAFIDVDTDDYRLQQGSPCIDTAESATAPDHDFYGRLRPQDGDMTPGEEPDMGFFERPPLSPGRLSGPDRYSTAAEIVISTFDSAETVVLASGQNFPDALSASGLAGAYEGPLLLTRKDSLPPATLTALESLEASRVTIVGGTGAVSAMVAQSLEDAGYEVDRVWGADRYATCAQVAREIESIMAGDFNAGLIVARGDNFPDALAAAPLAYDYVIPVVLTRPASLPNASKDAIVDLSLGEGLIVGGTGAVSAAVEQQINDLIAGKDLTRLDGANRYDTARTVAEYAESEVPGSFAYVGVARGDAFPDALAGGVAAGSHSGVVLLTRTASLPTESAEALQANKLRVIEVNVFGGSGAVSADVFEDIDDSLGW